MGLDGGGGRRPVVWGWGGDGERAVGLGIRSPAGMPGDPGPRVEDAATRGSWACMLLKASRGKFTK